MCTLAALDLWRQISMKNDVFWLERYSKAAKSRYDWWRLGYNIEDLEVKLDYQSLQLKQLLHLVDEHLAPKFSLSKGALRHNVHNIEYTRQARIAVHEMYQNDTSVHYIACGKDGPRLRVGPHDYRTDSRDMCQVRVCSCVY
ncbi:hypothetical protein EON64_16915 [archaeon]|nr:MAG: hypothetical protein EON64_16915 [archaeon]